MTKDKNNIWIDSSNSCHCGKKTEFLIDIDNQRVFAERCPSCKWVDKFTRENKPDGESKNRRIWKD